jgi:hypothetical protein
MATRIASGADSDNAIRRLNEFDRAFRRGEFDRDCLNQAIEDVNNILRHNRLSPRARQILQQDVYRLREFRASGASWRTSRYDPWP